MIHHGIIPQTSCLCLSGRGLAESDYRLFVTCALYCSIWAHILLWLGKLVPHRLPISEHFHQKFSRQL